MVMVMDLVILNKLKKVGDDDTVKHLQTFVNFEQFCIWISILMVEMVIQLNSVNPEFILSEYVTHETCIIQRMNNRNKKLKVTILQPCTLAPTTPAGEEDDKNRCQQPTSPQYYDIIS